MGAIVLEHTRREQGRVMASSEQVVRNVSAARKALVAQRDEIDEHIKYLDAILAAHPSDAQATPTANASKAVAEKPTRTARRTKGRSRRPSANMRDAILNYFRAHPGPHQASAVAVEVAQQHSLASESLRSAVSKLEQEGDLKRVARGVYELANSGRGASTDTRAVSADTETARGNNPAITIGGESNRVPVENPPGGGDETARRNGIRVD